MNFEVNIQRVTAILVSFLCLAYRSVADDEYEGLYTVTVEHSFNSGPEPVFSRRGVVAVRSLKSGYGEFLQDAPLTDDEISQLKTLATSNGIYRIRVAKGSDRDIPTNYVYSFMKACALYESRLSDKLTLHVDLSGNLIAASLSTVLPYCSGDVRLANHDLTQFNTTVDVEQMVAGPAPETQAYIQKLEQEKIEKAKGQQADNRGFFAKYWMYIVPALIFVMMSQSLSQNAAAQGGAE